MNELFNLVNHVTEVVLGAQEKKDVILTFLPVARKSKSVGSDDPIPEDDDTDERFNFFDVQGVISLHGFLLADSIEGYYSDSELVTGKKTQTPNLSTPGDHDGKGDYQITVKFRARVCRSVMRTDIRGRIISFDSCVLGSSYCKDFSITNKSEIGLVWTGNVESLDEKYGTLEFTDIDTGEPLVTNPISRHELLILSSSFLFLLLSISILLC
jgi:hypothetical protein